MIGYIYYILDLTNADMYIGSCLKENFNKRIIKHKSIVSNKCSSNNIIKNNNYIIEIIEENNFINNEELRKKEQYYIENNKCVNINNSYTDDEYKKKYSQTWRDNNKDYRKNYDKEYNKINKEKRNNDSREYYKNNRDKIAKYSSQYQKQKIECEKCKKLFCRGSMYRHKKRCNK